MINILFNNFTSAMYSTNTRATKSRGAVHRRRGADKRTLQQECRVMEKRRSRREKKSVRQPSPPSWKNHIWPLTPGADFIPWPLLLLHCVSKLHLCDAAIGCQSNSCVRGGRSSRKRVHPITVCERWRCKRGTNSGLVQYMILKHTAQSAQLSSQRTN